MSAPDPHEPDRPAGGTPSALPPASGHPRVLAVARDDRHRFGKPLQEDIELVAGLGVVGDAHAGATVKHRSRVRRDPSVPNLRQVHLMPAELFDHLEERGYRVGPGELGENVTTRGVDLLRLPRGARLRLGADAEVELTGLRNPCVQINGHSDGLMGELVRRDDDGQVVRLAGVMSIVITGGVVRSGDAIRVEVPASATAPLEVV